MTTRTRRLLDDQRPRRSWRRTIDARRRRRVTIQHAPMGGPNGGAMSITFHGPPPGPSPMAYAAEAFELGRQHERRRPR